MKQTQLILTLFFTLSLFADESFKKPFLMEINDQIGHSHSRGYLTRSQVEQISKELKKDNKLCAFHKKQI